MGQATTIDSPTSKLAPSESPRLAAAVRTRRVLVIDDDDDLASMLVDLLAMRGHDARAARDGPSGLGLAHSFRPEVAICDLGLPDMDGYLVGKALRAWSPRLVLLALSGYARSDDVERSLEAGFDAHVAKPPDVESLCRLVARPRSLS